ncbi:MAG: hypothetical protein JWN90_94 [Parcubacteria group bacterium]|nr:hypothetical protein [Parcubacteria group bacterium]
MKNVTVKKISVKIFAFFFIGVFTFSALPEYVHAQAGGSVASDAVGQAAGAAAACGIQALLSGGAAAGAAAGAGAGGAAVTAGSIASGWPVNSVAANALLSANLAANTAVAANTTVKNVKDDLKCGLDAIAWTVAKVTIQSITRSTVNWINSGFKGSPAFVSDLQNNLKYLGDAVANDFFNHLNATVVDVTGFNIKSPFQTQLNQKLRAAYYQETSGLLGLSAYDLQGHSKDPKAFLNGDFSQGGFNGFFSASQNPANNPFAAYKLASAQLWASIDAAAQQRKMEITNGRGFLSWRGACNPAPDTTLTNAATPGATSVDLNALDNAAGSAAAAALGQTPTSAQTAPKTTNNSAKAPVSLSQAEGCRNQAVRTPGSVIESQLEGALGTGIRQLELADSINEIVGALMGQLVNQVLGSGGLLGVSQPSSGGGTSYITQATDASQLSTVATSLANGVAQNIANDRTAVSTYQTNWQTVLTAANAAQKACGATPEITDIINAATVNIASSTQALALIDSTSKNIQNANLDTSNDKAVVINTAVINYQNNYIASPLIPSKLQQDDAGFQASITTGTSSSMYTHMTTLAASCHAQ